MLRRWKCSLLSLVLALLLCACTPQPPVPDPTPPPPEEVVLPEEPPTPDPVHFQRLRYSHKPVLRSQEQIATYVMYNLVRGKLDMEFYADRTMGEEWDIRFFMDNGLESTKVYNVFGAYTVEDVTTEDNGAEEGLDSRITLSYPHQDYDDQARAAAWAWVRENPPPQGGFTDFESEKAYALAIHDFVACRVTYDSMGYDSEAMNANQDYDALQEAYNVLGKDQKTAVCAGYARAFALIAQYAGINATWVRGNYEEDGTSHAWNVVYPCDGSEPVVVDVTWDDCNSEDMEGQTEVLTDYFYVPVSECGDHSIEDNMIVFLNHVNAPAIAYTPPSPEDAVG